jgi:hypothetical protein
MVGDWQPSLIDRLVGGAHPQGGWGYRPTAPAAAEATCLTCLALETRGVEPELHRRGLEWLAESQLDAGGVPVSRDVTAPCWPTALAIVAWRFGKGMEPSGSFTTEIRRALDWLLRDRGRPMTANPRVYGHNTQLTGWSWVEGTHSWVEPTAYAILALRVAGHAGHPRIVEGVELLLDRAIPGGGWNYGNTRVFDNTLRPFPGPTGIVLTALAGEPHDDRIEAGLTYLTRELPRIRAPLSLAWGLMGLRAWDRQPDRAQEWLAECAGRLLQSPGHAMYDALLLLADAEVCPFTRDHARAKYG